MGPPPSYYEQIWNLDSEKGGRKKWIHLNTVLEESSTDTLGKQKDTQVGPNRFHTCSLLSFLSHYTSWRHHNASKVLQQPFKFALCLQFFLHSWHHDLSYNAIHIVLLLKNHLCSLFTLNINFQLLNKAIWPGLYLGSPLPLALVKLYTPTCRGPLRS